MSLQPEQSRPSERAVVQSPVVQSLEPRRLLSITLSSPTDVAVADGPDSMVMADLTGDGHQDMIVANYKDNDVEIRLGNGNGTFQTPQTFATGLGPTDVVAAPLGLDGDGPIDLVVANYKSDNIGVLIGNGNGTFQAMTTYVAVDGEQGPQAVAVGDLNGDGIPDIAAANSAYAFNANGSISIFYGNG